jgi:hypothetical protein
MILQSDSTNGVPRLAGAMLDGNAGFQLRVTLNVPPVYRIQFTTDPASASWNDLVSLTNPASPFAWADTNTSGFPMKLYRIAAP